MADQATLTPAGLVDFGNTDFEPEKSYSSDPVRRFILNPEWPTKPFEDRKFQLGGVERVALLTEQPYMFYAHSFSQQHTGANINGYRRCPLDARGSCPICKHIEEAPTITKDGKSVKDARARKRTQRFGMNIIVYKTDLEGNLLDKMNQRITLDPERGPLTPQGQPAELVYEIFIWVFGADKFNKFRDTKKEWGDLRARDFICRLDQNKPSSFQDMDITPTPTSAWRSLGKQDEAAMKAVVEYYKEHKYEVEQVLGKLYEDSEMTTWITPGASPGPSRDAAGEAPLEDVAAEIEKELAGIQAQPTDGQPTAQPAAATQPPPPPPADGAVISNDFDALLAG